MQAGESIPTVTRDVARVAPKLWIGSRPPGGSGLAAMGFDVLVLCAEEYQPRGASFPGVKVLHAGFDDAFMPSSKDLQIASVASDAVMDYVTQGKRVLVTCQMGKNRSGLVVALSLMKLYDMSGRDAMAVVRLARPGALFNPAFARRLERL